MLKRSCALALALTLLAMQPAAAEMLRLAVSQKGFWDTSIPEFGERKGFFKEEGIELDLLYTNGTAETQQAVLSGSVDVGVAVGLLGLFAAYSKNAPVRVIASEWTGASDFFWYVKADSPVRTIADAAGRTIGFSTIGSSSNLVLLTLLEQASTKARPTATGGTSATMTQVMSGQIDVGWSVAPIGLQDAEQGRIRVIARGADVKGLESQTTRVTITNVRTLETRRDTIERFKRAYAKSLDWAYGDPQAIAWFAEGLGIPVALAKKAVDEHYPKSAMNIDSVHGLKLSMAQAIELKRLSIPLTSAQLKELFALVQTPQD
jgi:NitT/TauT family transport system substrate-binding protein